MNTRCREHASRSVLVRLAQMIAPVGRGPGCARGARLRQAHQIAALHSGQRVSKARCANIHPSWKWCSHLYAHHHQEPSSSPLWQMVQKVSSSSGRCCPHKRPLVMRTSVLRMKQLKNVCTDQGRRPLSTMRWARLTKCCITSSCANGGASLSSANRRTKLLIAALKNWIPISCISGWRSRRREERWKLWIRGGRQGILIKSCAL